MSVQAVMEDIGMDADSAVGRRALRRITSRLIVFLMFCYFVSYLDRVNVGFAALTMNKDIGLSATVYGWGSGLFFIGYFLFGVPSNIMLPKIGARRWIASLMVCWGFASMAMALVTGPFTFALARFLVGVTEAGFYPGVILYLTYWIPRENRARIIGLFSLAGPVSTFLGSPVSGALLDLTGVGGMTGWQWLFILEAAPAVILGVATLFILHDRPSDAKWLPADEQAWLVRKLQADQAQVKAAPKMPWWQALVSVDVWVLGLLYTGATVSTYGMSLWLPLIVKSHGLTNIQTGFVSALPFGAAAIGMVVWGAASDRANERLWHSIGSLLFTAAGLAASTFFDSLVPIMIALTIATVGANSLRGPFWALVTQWLPPATLGAGVAAINAIGNLGGFVGPFAIGWIKDQTGSYALTMVPLIVFGMIACAVTLLRNRVRRRQGLAGS